MKEKQELEQQYYSRRDIERLVGCGYRKAYELIKNEIPHIRLGKRYLVPKAEFEKWQEKLNQTAKVQGTKQGEEP